MVRKAITVHYRRLEDVTGSFNGNTLEQALRKALDHKIDGDVLAEHWKLRAWQENQDKGTLLINQYHDGGGYYFGDLTHYSSGHMQALIKNAGDAAVLDVEQQTAPEGREYVHSLMYWLVIGNHAFVIQSTSLRTKSLEDYFTWLLKTNSGVIDDNGQVILQVDFDPGQVGGDLEDINKIVVGGVAVEPELQAPRGAMMAEETKYIDQEQQHTLAQKRGWRDKAKQVLNAIMSSEADVDKLVESVPDGASLEVAVHVSYKTRGKKEISKAPMRQALRNLPEGEITAYGKRGKMDGKDIRLSYPASILTQGSLLDPEDVSRALLEAYQYFVNNGKIEA